jgi:hypothetical protein
LSEPTVTICVPTVSHRAGLLSRLLWSIGEQAERYEGLFEVLVHPGDNIPYGDKLNRMFAQAAGAYVVDCGDDDWVASDFLSSLIAVAGRGQYDCIGYKILYLENGKYQREIAQGAPGHIGISDPFNNGVTQRCWIRREIAISVPFGNHYTADREWGPAIQKWIKSATFVNRVLYFYDHWEDEMLGTMPHHRPKAWVDTNRVGTWNYDFPWWGGPRWLAI